LGTGLPLLAEKTAANVPDGERKTVTALFADLKGSMELMEDLDPEEARAMVDPALQLMIDAARRYGGYIVQSTGDGIFTLFGAPVAHEDHPQRALYAALRMQDGIRGYSARLREDGKLPIEARVGVNTGEVVVRSIATSDGHTEYTPIGHSISLAARMQAIAPTGSIAVTDSTRKLCEGYFTFRTLGPTRVKGVSDPVEVFEVTGLGRLRTRLQVAARRGLTKFVGREREMEALRHAAGLARMGHGQLVAAVGDPGSGKSRLFHEFKLISQSEWMTVETLSVSHGKASAYLPVIDLLHGYFQISSEDDGRKRREKVGGKVLMLERKLEDVLPYLFSLLGIADTPDPLAQMDGHVKKRRTLEAIKRVLLQEALNQPLMVTFEDLHWIDEQTQEFLNLLVDSIGTAKFLLLVDYRPEYRHEWGHKSYYTQLRLDPLGVENAQEMLASLLGRADELAPLKRLIIERTGGNPFFIEEIIQALLEAGTLVRNGEVKLTQPLESIQIPPTVQAMLAARIDRLPREEKELLQTLAVLGKQFTFRQLRATATDSDSELERRLASLQAVEFIYQQPIAADVEYTFKHALTQEVAYKSILAERRQQIHERAARALEALHTEDRAEFVEQLARHYVNSGNVPKAIEYLQQSAELAVARSSYREATDHLNNALELMRRLPAGEERNRRELALQMTLGAASAGVMGFGSAEREAAYNRAIELCRSLQGDRELFPALFNLCQLNIQRADLLPARELAHEGLDLAERLQDSSFILAAHYNLGEIYFWICAPTRSLEYFERACRLYEPRVHASLASVYGADLLVLSLTMTAGAESLLGRPDQALKRGRAALQHAHSLSHPLTRVYAPLGFEWSVAFRRDVHEMKKVAERAVVVSMEQGFSEMLAWAKCWLGWALIETGEISQGIADLSDGISLLDSMRDEIPRTMFVGMLADGYGRMGEVERALELLAEALLRANRTEARFYESELHRLSGELRLKSGSPDANRAENCFRCAIEVARQQSARLLELRATTSLARLLQRDGRRDEARTVLIEIYNWFTEGFDTADLKEAKALLDELNL
jgi:class 3 adenylate cyclase/predicted ATPase